MASFNRFINAKREKSVQTRNLKILSSALRKRC